jgi:hypothetical protein
MEKGKNDRDLLRVGERIDSPDAPKGKKGKNGKRKICCMAKLTAN